MLELRNIHKSFGDVRILGGVGFCLKEGFVYTLMGGNGAGKTTFINIIFGFMKLVVAISIITQNYYRRNFYV